MTQFVLELTAKYPQPQELPDDALANCVWSCDFDLSKAYCLLNIGWPFVDDVAPFVMELASKYRLICYDPQNDIVHLPAHLQVIH